MAGASRRAPSGTVKAAGTSAEVAGEPDQATGRRGEEPHAAINSATPSMTAKWRIPGPRLTVAILDHRHVVKRQSARTVAPTPSLCATRGAHRRDTVPRRQLRAAPAPRD